MSRQEQLWNELIKKNPIFLNDPHFTSYSIKRFYDYVYDKAFDHGVLAARQTAGDHKTASIFEQIFGRP
jgi:hypothetical protein